MREKIQPRFKVENFLLEVPTWNMKKVPTWNNEKSLTVKDKKYSMPLEKF